MEAVQDIEWQQMAELYQQTSQGKVTELDSLMWEEVAATTARISVESMVKVGGKVKVRNKDNIIVEVEVVAKVMGKVKVTDRIKDKVKDKVNIISEDGVVVEVKVVGVEVGVEAAAVVVVVMGSYRVHRAPIIQPVGKVWVKQVMILVLIHMPVSYHRVAGEQCLMQM
jgi:hypothetical protein